LFSPQFLLLGATITSVVAAHFRGDVKLGFWRQISDHSTVTAP